MARALFMTLGLVLAVSVSTGQDKPTPDRGEAIARLSVPGMQCDGTCPPTVKAALLDGPGVKEVTVDAAKKVATLRFEADKTHATDALARLVRVKPYASSQLTAIEAVFDGDYARATATSDVKKRRAKIKLTLEPRAGHTFNTERAGPDLEVALAGVPAGLKAREPVTKVKGGLKGPRTFELELDVDPKARAGEVTVSVEVRLDDTQGKDVRARAIVLGVPVLLP